MNTYFKFLSRNKFYTFVTVFGFAVSLMFVLLITVYVKQQLSVDSFHEKKDRIYFVAGNSRFGVRYSYADKIKDNFPEIEEAIPMSLNNSYVVKINDEQIEATTSIVGDNFFSVFSFPLLQGNKERVLQSPGNAVISESFARKAFGEKDPIGQVIGYDNSVTVTVAGVMKDIKNSVIPSVDIILPYANLRSFQPNMDRSSGFAVVAFLVKPGVDITTKNEAVTNYFKEKEAWDYQYVLGEKAQFIPLRDILFSKVNAGQLNQTDKSFVMVLLAVGVIILLFAIFNYINLTVAQTGFRAREMATRNLLGAKSSESFIRLVAESIVLISISLTFGILLAFASVSYVSNLLNTQLYLAEFFSPLNVILILLIVILLGIVSGIFPAYMISKFKPIDVVKGNFKLKNKMVFGKVFIVIQNVLTIVLITASIVMGNQIKHLISAPLGYNTKNIILLYVKYDNNILNTLVNEFEQLASVKRVALASSVPLVDMSYDTFPYKEKTIRHKTIEGDSVFFNMLGFEVMQENKLGYDHVNYFSETAYRELEMDDDEIVMPVFNWHVGGKVKDIQVGSILSSSDKVVIIAKKDRGRFVARRILLETQGNPDEAYKQIKDIYENITDLDFDGRYMDDIVEGFFVVQQRLQKIINLFAGIAILIALLGLIAISTYFIRQRTREIALKKVMGSTDGLIMTNLIQSFLTYVLVAFVIAVPIAYYFMRNWLDDYSYRIGLSPIYFIAAGLFCLLISAFTVFWQSYQAANEDPVKALKVEN